MRGFKALWGLLLIWSLLEGVSSTAFAQQSYGFKESTALSWETFVELIEEKKPSSIEQLLPLLKKEHPAFFENFVLMYRSKSLQEGSFQAPRAILFDESGQFVFSFNGNSQQRGYRALEVMHYQPEHQRFEFREILFSNPSGPQISEPNPPKCLQCHQSSLRTQPDPRPNWEPYNIWPGAYGSDSGRINDGKVAHSIKKLVEKNGSDQMMIDEMSQEFDQLRQFFTQTKPEHPRYQFLGFDHLSDLSISSDASFSDRQALSRLAHKTVSFTQFLANLNAERVLRLMQETDRDAWSHLKYALISQLKCGDWQIETAILDEMIATAPTQFIAREDTRIDHAQTDLKKEAYDSIPPEIHLSPEQIEDFKNKRIRMRKEWLAARADSRDFSISERIYLLFEGHGISIEDWSMDFKTEGRFAFRERFGTPSNTGDTFLMAARKRLPAEDWSHSCQDLRDKVNKNIVQYRQNSERFLRWKNSTPFSSHDDYQPLLATCVRCHDGGRNLMDSSIPSIPFSDPDQLAMMLHRPYWVTSQKTLLEEITHRLSDHATLDEQMPPSNRRPSLGQRRALINYFGSLVGESTE